MKKMIFYISLLALTGALGFLGGWLTADRDDWRVYASPAESGLTIRVNSRTGQTYYLGGNPPQWNIVIGPGMYDDITNPVDRALSGH